MGVNPRERERIKNLLHAWGAWVRDGRTWPNTLGYPRESVEARLMAEGAGAVSGGGGGGRSRSPAYTNWDREVIEVARAINRAPDDYQWILTAVYVAGLDYRSLAKAQETPRHAVTMQCRDALVWVSGAVSGFGRTRSQQGC